MKIFLDFKIQTEHWTSDRRWDQELINKKERVCLLVDFVAPADYRV